MNLLEQVKVVGRVGIVLTDAQGNVKDEREINNLVVTVGKNFIAARMKDTGLPTQMTHMAIGSGTVAAAAGDTALTELGRVALVTAGGTVSTNVVTYNATFPAGTGTGAVTEAGIFNAASSGTMLCRVVFAVVNKTANDSMAITWTVTIN